MNYELYVIFYVTCKLRKEDGEKKKDFKFPGDEFFKAKIDFSLYSFDVYICYSIKTCFVLV